MAPSFRNAHVSLSMALNSLKFCNFALNLHHRSSGLQVALLRAMEFFLWINTDSFFSWVLSGIRVSVTTIKKAIRAPVPWDSGQPVGRGQRYVVRTPGKLSFPRFIGALRTRGCKWEATERFGRLLKIKIFILNYNDWLL